MVDSSFEHRYITTGFIPVHSIGAALPGLTIEAHEFLMVLGRSCDVDVLNFWLLFSPIRVEQRPWPPSFSGYVALMLLRIAQPVVAPGVSFWWTQIAAMLLAVGQRFGIVTCNIFLWII